MKSLKFGGSVQKFQQEGIIRRLARWGTMLMAGALLVATPANLSAQQRPQEEKGETMAPKEKEKEVDPEIVAANPAAIKAFFDRMNEVGTRPNIQEQQEQQRMLTKVKEFLAKKPETITETQQQDRLRPYERLIDMTLDKLSSSEEFRGMKPIRMDEYEVKEDMYDATRGVFATKPPMRINIPIRNQVMFFDKALDAFASYNPEGTDEFKQLFRGNANPKEAYTAVLREYAESTEVLNGRKGKPPAEQAKDFAKALEQITSTKTKEDLRDAIALLNAGKLAEGLQAIKENSRLSAFQNLIEKVYVLEAEQRAFTVFSLSGTAVWQFENEKRFQRYLAGDLGERMSPVVCSAFANLTYAALESRGQITDTSGKDKLKPLTGSGRLLSTTLGATVCGGFTGMQQGQGFLSDTPYRLVFSADVGAKQLSLSGEVPKWDGGKKKLSIDTTELHVGVHGLELQFPVKGERSLFRLEKLGAYHTVGDIGNTQGFGEFLYQNWLLYGTFSLVQPWKEDRYRVTFEVSPETSWFFNEVRTGGSIEAIADFFRLNPSQEAASYAVRDMKLTIGGRYAYNSTTDTHEYDLGLAIGAGSKILTGELEIRKGFGDSYSPTSNYGVYGGLRLIYNFGEGSR